MDQKSDNAGSQNVAWEHILSLAGRPLSSINAVLHISIY